MKNDKHCFKVIKKFKFGKTKFGQVFIRFCIFFKFCSGRRALFSEEPSFEPLCARQTQRDRGRHACTHRHTRTHMQVHVRSRGCPLWPLTRSWSSLMTVNCLAHCPKRFFRSRKAHILQSLTRCMEASSEGHWCVGCGPLPSSSSSSYDS